MILIRGIKGEHYARKIEKGIVDCRDLLSALLQPPVTGYAYSDYYEKNIVKALTFLANKNTKDFQNPQFLYSILTDHYIPHIYLTYFHVLNENSIEWLDNFEDDYHFIALDVKIDKNTQTAIGSEYFGGQMLYVDSIRQLRQDGFCNFYAACMCSIENLFTNKKDMLTPLQIYNTLAFALLCREQDERFTDIENEFRIIAFDCPLNQGGFLTQQPRETTILGKSGIEYKGVLEAGKNPIFETNLRLLNKPYKLLHELLNDEGGSITLSSHFKSINVREISDNYKYVGNKQK